MYSLLLVEGTMVGLLLSAVVGASASGLLGVWVCMEANMLMFSAVLSFSKTSDEPQALKYFLVQSIGSAAMIAWVFSLLELSANISMVLVWMSMLLKLGLAPVHSWFISLASNIGFSSLVLLSTVQKMLPLIVLAQAYSYSAMSLSVILSAIIGVTGSIGQMEIKKLLAYSSVFNGAWMVAVSSMGTILWTFLFLYSISFAACIMLCVSTKSKHLSSWTNNQLAVVVLFLVFLSLGGIPPMIGFYAKLLAVVAMVNLLDFYTPALLVVSSVLLTYAYIRLTYTSLGFMAVSAISGAKTGFSSVVVIVVAPSLATLLILCAGVCTGNFGFPGLI